MTIAANVNSRGIIVLGRADAKHLYEIAVEWEHPVRGMQRMKIEAHADSRAQAASMTKDSGYSIRSVNMVG